MRDRPADYYLFDTGRIHEPRAHVAFPLFFTALRAESGVDQVDYTMGPVQPYFLKYGEDVRGAPYRWARYKRRFKPSVYAKFKEWLDKTPAVKEWFYSPTAMIAPRIYPPEVVAAFGKIPVPHPYELASFKRGCVPMKTMCNPDVQLLRSYCFGMSLKRLAEITGDTPPWIMSSLVSGAKVLIKEPCFQLWALNIDWEKTPWPPQLEGGILRRLKFRHKLIVGPQYMNKKELLTLTESPLFWKLFTQGAFRPRKNKLRKGLTMGIVGAPHYGELA